AQALPQPFDVGEVERPVPDEGPARGRAELIPGERRRPADVEEIRRIELVVAEELVHGAVETVRTGAGDGGHDAAGCAAVLGAEVLRQHAEFADALDPANVAC